MSSRNGHAEIVELLSSDSELEPEISVLLPTQSQCQQSKLPKRNNQVYNVCSSSSSDNDSFLNDPYPKLRKSYSSEPLSSLELRTKEKLHTQENCPVSTPSVPFNLTRKASNFSLDSLSYSDNSKKGKTAIKSKSKEQTNPSKVTKAVDKALKTAEAAARKSLKPGECMKHMTAMLDPVLLSSIAGGGEILTQLQALDVKCLIEQQSMPRAITWKRESINVFVDENNSVVSQSMFTEENQALLVYPAQDFLALLKGQPGANFPEEDLLKLISLAKQALGKRITVLVLGLEQYFKAQKTQERRNFRAQVQGNPRHSSELGITRLQVESALLRLQLEQDCMCWLLESTAELAGTVARITKAVAEAPFKRERDDVAFEFYAPGESAGIKVDKETGRGLARVWVHQLQQLPLASLETAQAVAAEYPSPSALLKAYGECGFRDQAALLLQDIVVRRGAGLLSSTRRVGPDFSKKVHKLLTSQEGRQQL